MPRRGSNNDTQTTDLGVFRLPSEFGKFAGKDAFLYNLESKCLYGGICKQNIVLPRAVGTKISQLHAK